jgi:hypothetical protein
MFVDFSSGAKGKPLVAWERKFEAMLQAGPHSALHGANKCVITMTTTTTTTQADDTDTAVAAEDKSINKVDTTAVTTPTLRGATTAQY